MTGTKLVQKTVNHELVFYDAYRFIIALGLYGNHVDTSCTIAKA